jgi:rRNA maturation endonuclease Nob1
VGVLDMKKKKIIPVKLCPKCQTAMIEGEDFDICPKCGAAQYKMKVR